MNVQLREGIQIIAATSLTLMLIEFFSSRSKESSFQRGFYEGFDAGMQVAQILKSVEKEREHVRPEASRPDTGITASTSAQCITCGAEFTGVNCLKDVAEHCARCSGKPTEKVQSEVDCDSGDQCSSVSAALQEGEV